MDTYSEMDSNNSAGTLSAFLIGAAVGAAAALILAPTTGRDARAYLRRRGNELGHDAMERGRETWRSQSERVKSAIATGVDRATDAVSHAREQGEAAYREARESFQSSEPVASRTSYRTDSARSSE
jgi:gas vesicle protein